MQFQHTPVLMSEILYWLAPQPNQDFFDGTIGGGGHSFEILKKIGPNGHLLGTDLDEEAIIAATAKLKEFGPRVIIIRDNFKNIQKLAYAKGFNQFDGILLDLGVSSYELQDSNRGFSFKGSLPLDMRMGQTDLTAAEILNTYDKKHLAGIFKDYGEERYANQIADAIIDARKKEKFQTTNQLTVIIENYYQHKSKPKGIHIATKIFQALRIEVNQELENLKQFLPQAINLLKKNGRIGIISFHSLEDRIVKDFFRQESKDCICPPETPICQCQHQASLKILTKKPIIASAAEIKNNPRSRSAKLRVALKI